MSEQKSAIVIGAHCDDCEAGSAAGVSAKLVKAGWRVVFLNTIGDHATTDIGRDPKKTAAVEAQSHEAAELLGAEKILLPFRHNMFHPEDGNAVAAIASVVKAVDPHLAIIPWPHDNHYDHARTARAALEALSYMNRFGGGKPITPKLTEILAYEISSWQTRGFDPDFYIDISDEMDAVERSIRTFSVFGERTIQHYIDEKRSRSRHWGVGAYCEYAEGLKHLGPQFPIASMLPTLFGSALHPSGSLQYPWGGKFFDHGQ